MTPKMVFAVIAMIRWIETGIRFRPLPVDSGIATGPPPSKETPDTETEAALYLVQLEGQYSEECSKESEAVWDFMTNIGTQTQQRKIDASNAYAQFQSKIQLDLMERFPNYTTFKNESLKRQIKALILSGPGNMAVADIRKMNEIKTEMEFLYSTRTVCDYQNPAICNYALDPEIKGKLTKSKDYDELVHYWTEWHNVMGTNVTARQYSQFVNLQNMKAKANGFNDMSALWLDVYNDESGTWTVEKFKAELESLWKSLEPYYIKLHTYVGNRLRENPVFKDKIVQFPENLPAHVFGNMWAQNWRELEPTTKPYPGAVGINVTDALVKKGFTEEKIFKIADDFFGDMGLKRMTETFWKKSMLTKPKDRDVVCHASAHDMCRGNGSTDFRIKMCTKVAFEDVLVAHHEMGHIEYFMQYNHLPISFRDGANPAFHEALGDSLALAVSTPKHLQCVVGLDLGLNVDCSARASQSSTPSPTDINFLYGMALDKIAFLPFAYAVDKWRWEVFDGTTAPQDYNNRWWALRKQYQRIEPPIPRNAAIFDPASKYHIVANVEYLRYFMSCILQFQFYEAMCIAAKEFTPGDPNSKPLYQCDFAGNKEAGKKLSDMMSLGFSQPWPKTLNVLTGSTVLSTSSLINYFLPLFNDLDSRIAGKGGGTPSAENVSSPDSKEALSPNVNSGPTSPTEVPGGGGALLDAAQPDQSKPPAVISGTVAENQAEPVSGVAAQKAAELVSGEAVGKPAEPTSGDVAEKSLEPVSGDIAEKADGPAGGEAVAEKPAEPASGDIAEKPAEPVSGDVAEKPAEPVSGDVAEKPAEPASGDVAEKPAAPGSGDVAEKPTEPVSGDVTEKPPESVPPEGSVDTVPAIESTT